MQGLVGRGGQILHQHLGHIRRDIFPALGHRSNGGDQFTRVASFVQVALGAGTQAADGVLVFRKHGDDQHLDCRAGLPKRCQDFKAATSGQIQIEDQHVAGGGAQRFPDFGIAACFGSDLNVDRFGQHFTDAAPHNGMVVTKNDADH